VTSEKTVLEKSEKTGGEAERDETGRPMRADARRNYERLVVAAREVFTEEGGGASMEAIAREAQRGPASRSIP